MDTLEKPDVLLVRHSFIRRLRDHLSPPEHGERGQDISGEPTSFSRGSSPITAQSANTADCVRGICTSSQRIKLILDLWKSESTAISTRPSFVLLHVGSNDLAQMTHVNKTSAENSAKVDNKDQPLAISTWSHDGIHSWRTPCWLF